MKTETISDDALLAAILDSEPVRLMSVGLDTKRAKTAVTYVAGVIGRTTLPVLNMIHVASNGTTTVTATDLDVTLTARLPDKAFSDGECLIPKSALLTAVKNAKKSLAIECKPKLFIDIATDGFKSTVPGLSVGEFPAMPKWKSQLLVTVSMLEFKAALRKILDAISCDESRYVLNGILVEIHPDHVVLVATDGRRLHMTRIERLKPDDKWPKRIQDREGVVSQAQSYLDAAIPMYENKPEEIRIGKGEHEKIMAARHALSNARLELENERALKQVILPKIAVYQLQNLPAENGDDTLIIQAGETKSSGSYCSFECGSYMLTSKQIEGNYPNYRQIIPREDDHKESVLMRADELAAAVRHASTVCTEKCNGIKLTLTKNLITVTGHSPDKGEAKAEVAVNYKGNELSIAFNWEYLLEGCTAFKGGEMTINLIDELSPGVFVDGETSAVVMPMRLS